MRKRPTSNAPVRTHSREGSPADKGENPVDKVIMSMNEKLKHLETRYQDLVSQCQSFRKLEQGLETKEVNVLDESDELGALRSLDQEKDRLDTELQLLLRSKKSFAAEVGEAKDARSTKQIYDSISEALHTTQSRILRLFHPSVTEFQAKTQASELFSEFSNILWGQIYKLRNSGDSRDLKQLINEVMRIEQAKQVLDLRISETSEALRQKYAAHFLRAKQRATLLRSENRRLEATLTGKFTASGCNSPVGLGPFSVEENQPLRSTAPSLSPGLYARGRQERPAKSERTSLSPLYSRRKGEEESAKDARLLEIRREVEQLRTQLSASQLDRRRPLLDSPHPADQLDCKKKLAVLTSEAKEYLKATKDLVRRAGDVAAEELLKSLTRTINDVLRDGPFSEWRRTFQKEWPGKVALEQTNKMLESENKRLEDALALEKSRADRLIEMVEAFQKDIQPKSQELVTKLKKEVKQLTDKKLELEQVLETERDQRARLKQEHDSALSDLVNDCQELNNEVKLLRTAKQQLANVSQQRDAEFRARLNEMEKLSKDELTRLIDSSTVALTQNYLHLEERLGELDERLTQLNAFIALQLKDTLQRLAAQSDSHDVESLLSAEREKMEIALQQSQDWSNSRIDELQKELETTEERRAALALDLLREKELTGKLTLAVEQLREVEARAKAAELLAEQLENARRNADVVQGRVKLLLIETEQLQYEKKALEGQIASLLTSNQSLHGETQSLREQLLTAKSESKWEEMEEVAESSQKSDRREVELGSANAEDNSGELERLRGELAEAQAQCNLLTKKLEEKDNQLLANTNLHAAELIELRTEYEETIRELQLKCGDLVDEMERLKNSAPVPEPAEKYTIHLHRSNESGPLPDLSSDRSHRDSELQRSKEELVDVSKKCEHLEKEVVRLNSSNLKMKGERMHLETEVSRAKSFTTQIDLLTQENQKLQAEVKTLSEENHRLIIANQVPQVAAAVEEYEDRINNYKEQLRARITANDELETRVMDLQTQLARQQDVLASKGKILTVALEEAKADRKAAVDRLTLQLSESREAVAHAEELLKVRTDAYTRVTEELAHIALEAGLGQGSNDAVLIAIREALARKMTGTDATDSPPTGKDGSPAGCTTCPDTSCPNKKKYEDLVEKYEEIHKDWKETLERSQQHKAALEAERKAAKLNLEAERLETDKVKRMLAKLEDDFFALKQQHSQDTRYLKEEYMQQLANKEQQIVTLENNQRIDVDREINPESPMFRLNPDDDGRIDIESEGSKEEESFQEQVQDIMDLTPGPGAVIRTVEYDGIVWQLIFSHNKDYSWRRAGDLKEPSALDVIHDLLQPVVPGFSSLPDAVQQLVSEVQTLRRAPRKVYSPDLEQQTAQIDRGTGHVGLRDFALNGEANSFEQGEGSLGLPPPHSFGLSSRDVESGRSEAQRAAAVLQDLREENRALKAALASEQSDSRRYEEMMRVLKDELRAKAERSKQQGESLLPHVRSAVIGLIVELPKLTAKGEAMLKTIYSHFELSQKQIGVLEQARKGKKQDKAGAVTQVLS